jgi:RNA polymerase sigma-B factor
MPSVAGDAETSIGITWPRPKHPFTVPCRTAARDNGSRNVHRVRQPCPAVIVTPGHGWASPHREFLMNDTLTVRARSNRAAADIRTGPGIHLDGYIAARLQTMAALAAGDPAHGRLRDEVICACLPVARRLASRFFGRGEPSEDLVQVATVGLIKAVDRFDPTRETEFLAYATPTILGEIKRHFRDKGWSVKVSRPLQELYLQITRVLPELTQQLGRTPRIGDIAAHLGVPEAQVMHGLECGQAYSTRSLSTPVGDGDGVALAETLGEEDPRMESAADRTTLRDLLAVLPDRERQILRLRFLKNLTQSEIAEQIGVSQMHVSRLLTRTLADLRERLLTTE